MSHIANKADSELILEIQRGTGNTQLLRSELFRRYLTPLMAYIARRFPTLDRDEITQQTLVKANRSLHRLSLEQSSFFPWLRTIARNTGIDESRRSKRYWEKHARSGVDINASACDGADPERHLLLRSFLIDTLAHLETINENYRKVIMATQIGGLSIEEAADALGLTITQVRNHQHRGRKALRRALKAWVS